MRLSDGKPFVPLAHDAVQTRPSPVNAAAPMQGARTTEIDDSDPCYASLGNFAHLSVDVVIIGETGSGKDVLARHIHRLYRPDSPFVAVNCAAIPESLAEAELFGCERGAYTGAVRTRTGKLEDASGGVLYLDEMDSCPLWLQAKLLRVLQDKAVIRVGSSKPRPCDFRLIVSSKVPLIELVRRGQFRLDLYFRLSVVEMRLLPLRCRLADAERLLRLFIRQVCTEFCAPVPEITPEVMAWVLRQEWPGNLRELRAFAVRYVLGTHDRRDISEAGASTSLRMLLESFERQVLSSCLSSTRGDATAAANALGVPPTTLHYRLRRLGLRGGVERMAQEAA